MERYYQIARCYRDEDFRADRQPEFTQLDIEMSFVEQDDVIELGEAVVARALGSSIGVELPTPIPRMTYAEAMARYGIGQAGPALRRSSSSSCTEYFAGHPVPGVPGAVRRRRRACPAARASRASSSTPGRSGPSSAAPRAWRTCSVERGRRRSAARSPRTCPRPSAPAWPSTSAPSPATASSSPPAPAKASRALLGAARLEIGRRCGLIDESAWSFVWVVDAPLFEPAADAVAAGDVAVGAGAWTAVHHAFTSPKPEFIDTFDTDPGPALAYAYDIVCNGNEIGGGSIRIHRRDVQERVFEVMGLSDGGGAGEVRLPARGVQVRRAAARRHRVRLGPHRHRCSPAPTSIRDVIAFPKSGGGYDPLTDAPAPITAGAAQGGRRRRRAPGIGAGPPGRCPRSTRTRADGRGRVAGAPCAG